MTSHLAVAVSQLSCSSASSSSSNGIGGDRGRALVLKSAAAAAGDLVLRAPPVAKMLLPPLWRSRCHRCFAAAAPDAPLSRCGRCRSAYYCSRTCQQTDWTPDHRAECPRLAQLEALRLHDSQKVAVLLLGRVMRRSGSNAASSTPIDEVAPTDLVWHDADLDQEALLLVSLAQKLQLVDESLSALELQRMISRFENNNFAITDELLLEIGAGCYPLGAMANHSCEPNCAITFSGKDQQVEFRATRAIVAGEEVTHAYVDCAIPRHERQRRLRQKYHFQCACVRCVAPLKDPHSKDENLDSDIDGVPEAQWNNARAQAVARAKAPLLQQPSTSSDSSVTEALQLALQALQTEVHAENTSLLQAYSALFSAEMERGSVSEAIPHGEQMLAFYRRVYTANHPLVGLHLFTLGDLHLEQGNNARAALLLREAKQILQITHGREHPFVALLSGRLQACADA